MDGKAKRDNNDFYDDISFQEIVSDCYWCSRLYHFIGQQLVAMTDIWFNRDMQAVNDLIFALALQMKQSHIVPINLPAFLNTDTYWNTTICKETTNDSDQKET